MVPMIDARSHNNHGPSLGINGILCEFPSNLCHVLSWNSCQFFLPSWSEWSIVLIGFRIVTGNVTIDTTVSNKQVKNRRNILLLTIYGNFLNRYTTGKGIFIFL